LPASVIFAHVLLAVTGLVFWVIYLLSDSEAPSWAAVGILASHGLFAATTLTPALVTMLAGRPGHRHRHHTADVVTSARPVVPSACHVAHAALPPGGLWHGDHLIEGGDETERVSG
jgi:hypothetical protein